MAKLIVIIQCEAALKRCSGVNCASAFYSRTGLFTDVPADARYLSMSCGGCCGSSLPAKLENLSARLKKLDVTPEDVTIHLGTCLVSENHHRPPCPFRGYIKQLLVHKGFPRLVSGTYISKKAQSKRDAGIYRPIG